MVLAARGVLVLIAVAALVVVGGFLMVRPVGGRGPEGSALGGSGAPGDRAGVVILEHSQQRHPDALARGPALRAVHIGDRRDGNTSPLESCQEKPPPLAVIERKV